MIVTALDHQNTFRALMEAMSRPGQIRTIRGIIAPSALAPTTAAVVSSLADYETPVWLDPIFAQAPAVREWIRFTTGASIVDDPRRAVLAVIADSAALPEFSNFAQGEEEYPDRSATLIVQCVRLGGKEFVLTGPGIRGAQDFAVDPLPVDFVDRWAVIGALFPRGIDLVFVAENQAAALPRTVHVSRKG